MAAPAALVRKLLSSQVQCVLATVGPPVGLGLSAAAPVPSTHLMAFGLAESLKQVFLATKVDTQKAENMVRSPWVSLLWDNRTGKLEDHSDGMLVTASGVARLTSGADAEEARAAVLTGNPNFKSFIDQPTIALFAVDVSSYDVVVGYGAPVRWSPSDPSAAL